MTNIARRIQAFGTDLAFNLVANKLFGTCLIPRNLRWVFLRLTGMKVARSGIAAGTHFGSRRIVIGEGVRMGPECFLDGAGTITLEPYSGLGPRTMIITGSHTIDPDGSRAGELEVAPVVIGARTWICANVTIMPGVTIGEGCIVSAGSIVSRDLAPNGLYAGSPARRVRDLPPGLSSAQIVAQAGAPEDRATAAA